MQESELIKWAIVGIFAIFIGLIFAGSTKKVVVFYDFKDLMYTAGIILVPLGMVPLTLFFRTDPNQVGSSISEAIIAAIAIAGIIYCLFKTFKNAIKYNRSLAVGLVIGLFKAVMAILSVMIMFTYFMRASDQRTTAGGFFLATIFLFLFGWLMRSLINGPEVEKSKNWAPISNA